MRTAALLVALAGASFLGGAPAGASTGVSIDVGSIAVSQRLAPGGVYRLPVFGVRNPGDEATKYRLSVTYVEGQTARQPPESWFRFTPATLTLRPGESRPVSTRLEISPGADPGDYAALIGPRIVAEGGGAQVGATAAAKLSFEVAPSSGLAAWWRRLKRAFSDHAPWTWLAPAALLATMLGWQLRRRFTFNVARKA